MLIAYEVHTLEGGSWQIASMFDDKELALIEARRLEEGLRRRETRVVEETHDEESKRTKTRVIYTSPKIGSSESASQGAANAQPATREYPRARRQRGSGTSNQPSLLWLCLKFLLIVTLGVTVLVMLRQL
jgi:hypothetical protein